jgi:hypothetical protein
MARLVVASGNLHNHKAAVDYLRRRSRPDHPEHFDICFTSEAWRRRRALSQLLGHDYLTGTIPGPSQETGILLSRALPNYGHGAYFLSAAAPQWEKIGKERWGQEAVTEFGGVGIALINLHPVPGPEALRGNDPDHPLVERYAAAMRWLEATIARHRHLGHQVIAGGDLQMREHEKQLWAPRHVFADHKMTWHWGGIDAIAWTRGLTVVGSPRRRTDGDFPSDHPLLRVELELTRTN